MLNIVMPQVTLNRPSINTTREPNNNPFHAAAYGHEQAWVKGIATGYGYCWRIQKAIERAGDWETLAIQVGE